MMPGLIPPLAERGGIQAFREATPVHDLSSTKKGFTLIEAMITLAIIGILAAIAYPSYQQHIVKSNRAEAQAYLMEVAQRQQQYLMAARSYASQEKLGLSPSPGVERSYAITFTIVTGPPPGFTITATPKAGTLQASDGVLTIDQAGTKLRGGDSW